MKTLVVGDLHLKQQFVLPRIDGMLAGDAEIGRVVFLGDACDDWGANEADELNAMEFYAKWVREHRGRGMRIDVLLGNGLPAGLLGTGAVVGAEEAAQEDGGGEGKWKNDAGVFHGGASFASKS